jgi:glucose/mannose-6-phosphate isomerase
MHAIYDVWPSIAKKSYFSGLEKIDFKNIDHVVFSGMGGSGAIGDLFHSVLSKSDIHVSIVKGYLLPKTVDTNTLVVTTSVSGNTSETLNVLKSASELDCKIIGFSSGGMMEQFCLKNNIEFRKISQIHSPRASFVKYVYSILHVLDLIIPIDASDVKESIIMLEKIFENINSDNLTGSNHALGLAEWISGIPLIYYPWGLQAAAIRFKNSLQENTKTHAIIEDVIEACHNGIVSWESKSDIQPILIQGKDDYVKTQERWQIIKDYFKQHKISYYEIESEAGNIISKIMGLTYLLDYASIYRAVLSKNDPSPVTSIDFIKKRL